MGKQISVKSSALFYLFNSTNDKKMNAGKITPFGMQIQT